MSVMIARPITTISMALVIRIGILMIFGVGVAAAIIIAVLPISILGFANMSIIPSRCHVRHSRAL